MMSPSSCIPKIIHCVWLQGADKMPKKYKRNVEALRKMNPDWFVMLWCDETLGNLCKKLGFDKAYATYPKLHQKVDLGRYAALYAFGGCSVDVDCKPLRPFDHFPCLPADTTMVSVVNLNAFESAVYALANGVPADTPPFNNAFFACAPGTPVMRQILVRAVANAFDASLPTEGFQQISKTTGPSMVNDVLRTVKEKDLLWIAPPTWFEPCAGADEACTPAPDSFLDHQHANSWMHGTLPATFRAYFAVKRNIVVCVASILLLSVVSCIHTARRKR